MSTRKTVPSKTNPAFYFFTQPPKGHAIYNHRLFRTMAKTHLIDLNWFKVEDKPNIPDPIAKSQSPEIAAIQIANWQQEQGFTLSFWDRLVAPLGFKRREGNFYIQGFGDEFVPLMYHPEDAVQNPNTAEIDTSTLFNAVGIRTNKEWMERFCVALKNELKNRNLQEFFAADFDIEYSLSPYDAIRGNGRGVDLGTFKASLRDPRASTEEILPGQTLAQIWKNDSVKYNLESALDSLWGPTDEFISWYMALQLKVFEYAAEQAWFSVLRKHFPGIRTSNWGFVSLHDNQKFFHFQNEWNSPYGGFYYLQNERFGLPTTTTDYCVWSYELKKAHQLPNESRLDFIKRRTREILSSVKTDKPIVFWIPGSGMKEPWTPKDKEQIWCEYTEEELLAIINIARNEFGVTRFIPFAYPTNWDAALALLNKV